MKFGQAVVLKLFKKDMFNESLDAYFGFGLGGCKKGSQRNPPHRKSHIHPCVCRNVLHMTPAGARKKDKVLQCFTVFGMISCIQYTPTNLQFHDTLNWPVCNSESPTAALSLAYQDPRERYQEHIREAANFFPYATFSSQNLMEVKNPNFTQPSHRTPTLLHSSCNNGSCEVNNLRKHQPASINKGHLSQFNGWRQS